ncbi:hypothetical protein [Aureibacter tunicatorum]|uniref:Outer membrane protein beta-barrel domain-containing protein n=1 Tax=Aureibacter tunicatorum TaxID=866807 RepID=A0AAE3XMG6_9BACT|nr:hypothetical protein [Aureibacter tunicatorum]MDR6237679.1 hypothetical protein [Aureibacter tunicatorum]BDD02714.1 hypothetical protein AUTU_01970 [Aureibacter tunicatorum]
MKRFLLVIAVIAMTLSGLRAQRISGGGYSYHSSPLSKVSIFMNGGISQYQGEVSSFYGSNQSLSPMIGFGLGYNINNRWKIRGEGNYYTIQVDDIQDNMQLDSMLNVGFWSRNLEGLLMLEWVVFDGIQKNKASKYFDLRIFAGFGLQFSDTNTSDRQNRLDYQRRDGELYEGMANRIAPIIPVGANITYHITDQISIALETSFRYLLDDYADGYSIENSEMDYFLMSNLQLTYRFWSQKGSSYMYNKYIKKNRR